MHKNRPTLIGLSIVALIMLAHVAHGQTVESPADLFKRAVILMEAGDVAAACPLLQESYDREPKEGRLITLAHCRDGEGKLATALELYGTYLRAVAAMDEQSHQSHAEREQIALSRVQDLKMKVPKLNLVWRGNVPKDAKVTVDGVDALARLNTEWPLDPGEHEVVVERGGHAEAPRVVTLESGKAAVEVDLTPVVVEAPTKQLNASVSNSSTMLKTAQVSESKHDTSTTNWRRTSGFIAIGVGGAGLVLGTVMGGMAISQQRIVMADCRYVGTRHACSGVGLKAKDEVVKFGTASTVGFVTGGLLAASGLVLLLTAPKTKESPRTGMHVRVSGGMGIALVQVEGAF